MDQKTTKIDIDIENPNKENEPPFEIGCQGPIPIQNRAPLRDITEMLYPKRRLVKKTLDQQLGTIQLR